MNKQLESYLQIYPELNDILPSFVLLPDYVCQQYFNDVKIEYKNMEISCLLLVDLITCIYFRKKVKKLFDGEIRDLKIGCECNGEFYCDTLTRKELIEAFQLMKDQELIYIPQTSLEKFEYYKEKISYNNLLEITKDKKYKIEIDKQEYEIPINDMLYILQMNSSKLDEMCNDEDMLMISNIKKEYFFYAIYKYVNEENILNNYLVSNNVIENYNRLSNMEIIDFEAINKFYKYDDGVNKVKLSEELENEILKNMPSNLNKLEKCIYIYLKMCKLLSYDEEYFFANMEASVLNKHKDIEHLQTITLENNKVVCYEFNAMYAKMLKDLKINFQCNNSIKDTYGYPTHTMLDFRCGKYLVSADSITSVFSGDIINVKLNGVINGLNCDNKNQKTALEFYKMLGKVYKIIKEEEEPKYFNMTDFDSSNVIEKLNILIDKTNFKEYEGMDFISFVLKQYKMLFNEEEKINNIKLSIVKDYKEYLHGAIIFCVNTQGFNIGEENTYYLFDSRRTVLKLNRIELQDLFDEGVISYYSESYYDLPGIKKNLKR